MAATRGVGRQGSGGAKPALHIGIPEVPAFVGREDVFAAVTTALDQGPSLVLIEGEAGIGKTRLVHEVLASRRGCVAMVAACPPLEEPFPLGPVVEGLRWVRPQGKHPELSPLGGALRPLFPEWSHELPPMLEVLDDPRETRHRVFRALTELVERLGVELLVVEDAHWADTATLEWLLTLTAVAPGPDGHARSIAVTYRPTDVSDGSLLWRLTSRIPAGLTPLRVALDPLDVAQSALLVGSMLDTESLSDEFAQFLHERTDGIPLALEESILLMRARHDLISRGGRWTRRVLDELEVPPTVRDSVLERVGRLDPDARAVLHAAAVLAEPADGSLLTSVAELDEQAGRRGVTGGLVAGLLREVGGGRLAFRHVLDAQAVLEGVPASERWVLHRRAAQALQRTHPEPVVRLARHFCEANDTENWCHYGEATADLALGSGDDRTAVLALLDLLTRVVHPVERRSRLARKLGKAASLGATPLGEDLQRRMSVVLREILELGSLPPVERGEIRLQLGHRLRRLSDEQSAYEEIEAAISDLVDRPDLACLAMTTLAYPLISEHTVAWHLRWLDRAAALLPKIELAADRLAVHVLRETALLLLGEEKGWQAAVEMPEPGPSTLEQRAAVVRSVNLTLLATIWGRYTDARRRLEASMELMRATGLQESVDICLLAAACLDWYTGAWESANQTAMQLAESDDCVPVDRLQARQIQGLCALARGARSVAERHLGEVSTAYARLRAVEPAATVASAALGRLLVCDDAHDEALESMRPAMDMVSRKGVWLWATDIAPVQMEALIGAGCLTEAETLLVEFGDGIKGRNAPAPEAALVLCQGLMAQAHDDLRTATALYGQAASLWAVLPRPYDELLAAERQGLCLLADGDHDRGLRVLSTTQQRLTELGASWDADRLARALRLHGVQVVRPWRRGRRGYGGELSPREREVAERVAQGETDRQIAEALFLSPKTVSKHVSAAMTKLGVSSRTALAVAASEAQLFSRPGLS